MGIKLYLKGTRRWDAGREAASVNDLQRRYESGESGVYFDPEANARFLAEMPDPIGEDAAHKYGFVGSGKGMLSLPYLHVLKYYPNAFPGPPQLGGSCVSHGQKNANVVSMCSDIALALPDEVTGKLEIAPEISAEAERSGVLSTEAIYWYRGHGGHGWFCGSSAMVSTTSAGLVLRKEYDGFDLTKVSNVQMNYGSRKPPESVTEQVNKNLLRTSTKVSEKDALRDYIAEGYGVNSCGGESFSNTRDEFGFSARTREGWPHSMAYFGVDDRPEAVAKFGDTRFLVMNSWGRWNKGPREVWGTNILIPEGSFWANWNDIKNRDNYVMSGAHGWTARPRPTMGGHILG